MSMKLFYKILKTLLVSLYAVAAALSPTVGGGDFDPSARAGERGADQ